MTSAAILGASGYAGQETLDRVLAHPALELYALESRLGQARAEVAQVASDQEAVAREQRATRRRLAVTTQALHVSQQRLAALVRTLYEQSGRTDPISAVLGAQSLEEAEEFLCDRGLLTLMPDSSLPSLFGACHEEPYRPGGRGFARWPR